MNDFYLQINLPVSKKLVKIKELKNIDYKNILKYIISNDSENLSIFFDNLINEYSNVDFPLTNIDKFIILLTLRSVCIGNVIEFQGIKDGNKTPIIKINLDNIIQKFNSIHFNNTEFHSDSIKIVVNYPKTLIPKNIQQIYSSIIDEIYIENQPINYWKMTELEREDVINVLDGEFLIKFNNYVNRQLKELEGFIILSNIYKVDNLMDIPLNPFSTLLMELLKSLYNGSLENYYEVGYILCKHAKISLDYYDNMIPVESQIYLANLKKEKDEQEKDQKENERKSMNVS